MMTWSRVLEVWKNSLERQGNLKPQACVSDAAGAIRKSGDLVFNEVRGFRHPMDGPHVLRVRYTILIIDIITI
jgi:hypothetical protein